MLLPALGGSAWLLELQHPYGLKNSLYAGMPSYPIKKISSYLLLSGMLELASYCKFKITLHMADYPLPSGRPPLMPCCLSCWNYLLSTNAKFTLSCILVFSCSLHSIWITSAGIFLFSILFIPYESPLLESFYFLFSSFHINHLDWVLSIFCSLYSIWITSAGILSLFLSLLAHLTWQPPFSTHTSCYIFLSVLAVPCYICPLLFAIFCYVFSYSQMDFCYTFPMLLAVPCYIFPLFFATSIRCFLPFHATFFLVSRCFSATLPIHSRHFPATFFTDFYICAATYFLWNIPLHATLHIIRHLIPMVFVGKSCEWRFRWPCGVFISCGSEIPCVQKFFVCAWLLACAEFVPCGIAFLRR